MLAEVYAILHNPYMRDPHVQQECSSGHNRWQSIQLVGI